MKNDGAEHRDTGHETIGCFLDGTFNAVDDNTNVWRLKSLCAKDKDGADQLVYYAKGVNGFWGGVFGKGLDDVIRGAYEWLIDQYADGDEVFIFGFSRGAYAARSLAGLITKCGLLTSGGAMGVEQIYTRYQNADADTIWELWDRGGIGKEYRGALAPEVFPTRQHKNGGCLGYRRLPWVAVWPYPRRKSVNLRMASHRTKTANSKCLSWDGYRRTPSRFPAHALDSSQTKKPQRENGRP